MGDTSAIGEVAVQLPACPGLCLRYAHYIGVKQTLLGRYSENFTQIHVSVTEIWANVPFPKFTPFTPFANVPYVTSKFTEIHSCTHII